MQAISYILKIFGFCVTILHTQFIIAAFATTHEMLQNDPLCQTELFQATHCALATLKQYELKIAEEAAHKAFQKNIERLILLLSNNVAQQPAPIQAKKQSKDANNSKPFSCPEPNCAFRCQSAQGLKQHHTMIHIKKDLAKVMLCLAENQQVCDTKKSRCSGCQETFTIPGFKKHKDIMLRTYRRLIDPNPVAISCKRN